MSPTSTQTFLLDRFPRPPYGEVEPKQMADEAEIRVQGSGSWVLWGGSHKRGRNHREGTLEVGVEIPLQPLADPEPHRCRVRSGGSAESSRWGAEGWVEMLGLTQAHPEWSAPAHQEPFLQAQRHQASSYPLQRCEFQL